MKQKKLFFFFKMHLHQQCEHSKGTKKKKKNIYIKNVNFKIFLIWFAVILKRHFTFTDLQKINDTAQQPAANNCYIYIYIYINKLSGIEREERSQLICYLV